MIRASDERKIRVGRTPYPLTIWLDDAWLEHPWAEEMRAKGHTIIGIGGTPDLILSHAAHKWMDEMWPYRGILDASLKDARAKKKLSKWVVCSEPAKKKEAKKKNA